MTLEHSKDILDPQREGFGQTLAEDLRAGSILQAPADRPEAEAKLVDLEPVGCLFPFLNQPVFQHPVGSEPPDVFRASRRGVVVG